MSLFEPKFERSSDKLGFSKKIPWTDKQCILLCLENCMDLTGQDKKQIERIIKTLMEPRKVFPNRLIDKKHITCTVDDVEVDCDSWDEEYPAL